MENLKPDLIYTLYKFGKIYPEELPKIATAFLEQGFENEYLIEIAGFSKPSQTDVADLVDKAFAPFLPNKFDFISMAIIIAKAIIDNDLDTYTGAVIISEIYEETNNNDDLWIFKCNVMQYNDYAPYNFCQTLGTETSDLLKWQKEIMDDIRNDAMNLIEKYEGLYY